MCVCVCVCEEWDDGVVMTLMISFFVVPLTVGADQVKVVEVEAGPSSG